MGLLEASAAFGPPRDGLRLPDNDFWWTVASCRDGVWGFQAYHYPTDGFANVKFAEQAVLLRQRAGAGQSARASWSRRNCAATATRRSRAPAAPTAGCWSSARMGCGRGSGTAGATYIIRGRASIRSVTATMSLCAYRMRMAPRRRPAGRPRASRRAARRSSRRAGTTGTARTTAAPARSRSRGRAPRSRRCTRC